MIGKVARFVLIVWLVAFVFSGLAGAAQFQEILPGTFPSAVGGAWGDYDGDGYPDLFISGADTGTPVPVPHGPLLYRNNNGLAFTDVSSSLGLPFSVIEQSGVAWGDYNNNGLLDVLVAGASHPYLYKLETTGFVEVAETAGFPMGTSAGSGISWCDYNGDNLLDAFCSNIFGPGYLMKNNGDGTFTESSTAAGMVNAALNDYARSAAWGDYNNDDKLDLALARFNKATKLYRNNGDGTFTDVSDQSGVSLAVDCSSVNWGDYDNDGYLDLFVSGWLFHNNHDGTFTDVSASTHVLSPTGGGGAVWADFNNDTFLDLYIPHWHTSPYFYSNNGNSTFTNIVAGSGLEATSDYQGAGAAVGDIDLDGRLDLFQCAYATNQSNNRSLLFHNINFSGNNWLRVRTLTSGTGDATSDIPIRDSIGARIDLNLDNDRTFPTNNHRTLMRLIDGGSGFCAQNEQVAHFGIGSASRVAVRVRFPDGSVVVHRNVSANQQITIRDVPAGRVEIFDDVPLDYWAYTYVKSVVDAQIASGYPDGTYAPSNPVTRDQMAVFISRAMAGGDANIPAGPATATFTDVPNTGYGPDGTQPYWAYKYIEYAAAKDVVGGYPEGDYKPTLALDRGQMAVFIARAIAPESERPDLPSYTPPTTSTFPDVTAENDWSWAYKYVEYIAAAGVTQGYPDGLYHPEAGCTRDQMAVYIQRAFQLPM